MPIGMAIRSKNGAPTEILSLLTASTMSGKTVPSSTTNANAANSRLLAKNAPSRDTGESIRPGDLSRSPRQPMSPTDTATTSPKNPSSSGPIARVREGVHRLDDAGAGEERPEDREAERGAQQRQVPDAQHPAPLLHHDRVQVRGAAQPRQERRVLDRVPRPVPAPTQHLVAPPGAEDDAGGEEAPGEQRPATGLDQPALADPAGDQRGDGERERHREPDVAEVEHRRVERHQDVVLQQLVRARPVVGRRRRMERLERTGRPEHQDEEERGDDEQHDHRPADQRVGRGARGTSGRPRACSRRGSGPTAGSSPRARPTWWPL